MRFLRHLLLASTAGLLLAGAAQAADLPTKKTPPAPPATSCFASFYDYMNSTAADCPLSYKGITLYATIDVGVGYMSHGEGFNREFPTGPEYLVSKNEQGAYSGLAPNALSQSNVGIKIKEEFTPGWSLVGDVNTGFDPYTLQLANGPGPMLQNNENILPLQNANGDSSRAAQWDNTRGYLGVSNATFGTLTAGRLYSLQNDSLAIYDPMGGSYAFSPIGYSGAYVGTGQTEDARFNTAAKYAVTIGQFRAMGIYQFGGYGQGNASDGAYQAQVGGTFGGLSVDAIYSYVKDAVNLANFPSITGGNYTIATGANIGTLKATLSDDSSVTLLAKYTMGPAQFFGGYEYIRFANPSDSYANNAKANGFTALDDIPVLAANVTLNTYIDNKILQIMWTGAKYSVLSNLDITGAYYHYNQNNFYSGASATACVKGTQANTGSPLSATGTQTINSACAGTLDAVSALIDWRPLKRLDVYAGLMYSQVNGGLSAGYLHTNNIDPTVGLRLSF